MQLLLSVWNQGMPVADAPVPIAPPRRLSVSAVTLVIVLIGGFAWGVAMFVVGRSSVEKNVADPRLAAAEAIAVLHRADQYIEQKDFVAARNQLEQLAPTTDAINAAVKKIRLDRMQHIEAADAADAVAKAAALAAEEAAKKPEAIAARLRALLWEVAVPGLAWHDPNTQAVIEEVKENKTEPKKTAVTESQTKPNGGTPQVEESHNITQKTLTEPQPLAAEIFNNESFIPSARVVHPNNGQRVYVLHPQLGLLRSDDGGKKWQRGVSTLQKLTGKQMAFSAGDEPLLVITGEKVWVFADRDPAFFER